MIRRRLVPLGLIGLLTGVSVVAAVLGVVWSPQPVSGRAQSKLFRDVVQRTLDAKSFTVHSAGEALVYQAPDHTSVVESSGNVPPNLAIVIVDIGSHSYEHSGGVWLRLPEPEVHGVTALWPGGRRQALEYLRALLHFPRAKLRGDVFTVHEVASRIPVSLQTLMFTTFRRTYQGVVDTRMSSPSSSGRMSLTGHITVRNGFVVSESFRARGKIHLSGRKPSSHADGQVAYSRINSSPRVAAPTKADLRPPKGPACVFKNGEPLNAPCGSSGTIPPSRSSTTFAAPGSYVSAAKDWFCPIPGPGHP